MRNDFVSKKRRNLHPLSPGVDGWDGSVVSRFRLELCRNR